MSVIRKLFYKPHFVKDKFDKKYPFDVKRLPGGYYKSFGDKNPDKFFFVIWRDFLGSGFFANFTQVVQYASAARSLGMIPVVDFKNFQTLYKEKEPVFGTENAWEYYFEQISPYSLDEVYASKNVIFCNGENFYCQGFPSPIGSAESYKKFWHENIRLKSNVEDELNKFSHYFNERILGVHFRGKEMNVAQLHKFGPTIEQMFRYTDQIMSEHNLTKIFLCTEDKDYADVFVARYGDKVLFSDAFRVAKVNAYNIYPRPQHRYLLGLDALVDSLLLSKCNVLLFSDSGLSINSARLGNHEATYYIDNGINSGKWYIAKFAFRVKKFLPKGFGGLKDELIKGYVK